MKKIVNYLFVLFIGVLSFVSVVSSKNFSIYVNIETGTMSIDGVNYQDIVKYDDLEEFLDDYKSNKLPEIYLTSFLFDGVSSVKTFDLDDFIESGSNSTKIKTLKINVLNINTTGDIELTGTSKGYMIGVNTNELKGNINLILNNVNIDTDTKKAPCVYVYNKDITYTDVKVTIKSKAGSLNYIEGGKFKKTSLMASDELDSYSKYYSGDNLSNYEKYSSYYGVYTKDEIKNILFASVTADSDGLKDGDPYYFYKGSGVISSDIDLYFEGEGYLKVISKNKEGIETKGNLVFSGGTGDYEINSMDDCLNTSTKSSAGKSVRNNLIIDVNTLVAIVNDEGDEGDAIDSNGMLTINGGNIYAFAHSSSGDAGLDSENGTIINGGRVIATGNMVDRVSSESKQNFIYVSFDKKQEKDTLIVLKDQDNNIIIAFKTGKDISTLFYSSDDLDYEKLTIYSGGFIDGEEVNGLYTKINSYEDGSIISYKEISSFDGFKEDNFILKLLIVEVISLVILIGYILISKYMLNKKIPS